MEIYCKVVRQEVIASRLLRFSNGLQHKNSSEYISTEAILDETKKMRLSYQPIWHSMNILLNLLSFELICDI